MPLALPIPRTSTLQIVAASVLSVFALVGALALASGLVVEAPASDPSPPPHPSAPPAPLSSAAPVRPAPVAPSPAPATVDSPAPSLALSIAPPVDEPMPVLDPAAARAERKEARAALELRDLARARDAAARAVRLDPEHADGWLLLGAAYLDLHEEWAARRAFASCAKRATRGPRGECVALIR